MNRGIPKYDFLKLLNEDEINIVCKNTDLNFFLEPIKIAKYKRYAKNLGRLDKKSTLVQTLLPTYAFELFKKDEEPFRRAVLSALEDYLKKFNSIISEKIQPAISIEEIRNYEPYQIAELYLKLKDVFTTEIQKDLFYIILKLNELSFTDIFKIKVESEIEKIKLKQELEKKYMVKIEQALKEQEKKLGFEYSQEEKKIVQQVDEYKDKLLLCQKEKESVEKELNSLETQIRYDRQEMEAEWKEEFECMLQEEKIMAEENIKQMMQEAEREHNKLLKELVNEADLKRENLDKEYQQRLADSEKKLQEELEELNSQIHELIKVKDTLINDVDVFRKEKDELSEDIQELKNIGDTYIETLERHIIEKKFDRFVFKKMGITDVAVNSESKVMDNFSGFWTKQLIINPDESEYGEPVEYMDHFIDDFAHNIRRNFKSEMEIAKTVLAAILSKMSIVASTYVCKLLAQDLAALVDLGNLTVINVDSNNVDILSMINTIKKINSQVICINGVLDFFDEITFTRIYEECNDKYLFFTISNIEGIQMMSKAIFNKAVIIDIEEELCFKTNEKLLIENHNLELWTPKLELNVRKGIMKKIFNRIVSKNLMRKETALKYCEFVQYYYAISNSEILNMVIQKAIVASCDITDKNTNVLKECGITILSK